MNEGFNQRIYDFIFHQIKDTKYLPSMGKDKTRYSYPSIFKKTAEEHYAFPIFPIEDWDFAFTWCIANVYGDGCEPEMI